MIQEYTELSAEEEALFIRRAQQGDAQAMLRLCEQYRPLVRSVAHRYDPPWRDDAEQEGWLALLKSIHTFQPHIGVRLAGYASAIIRGDVRSALRRETRHTSRRIWSAADGSPDAGALARNSAGGGTGRGVGAGVDKLALLRDGSTEAAYEAVEWAVLVEAAKLSARELQALSAALEGLGVGDVADREGVSVETVKTWRKRGFRKMRAVLEG